MNKEQNKVPKLKRTKLAVNRNVFEKTNKTKDWALVQTAALAINQGFNVGLG